MYKQYSSKFNVFKGTILQTCNAMDKIVVDLK